MYRKYVGFCLAVACCTADQFSKFFVQKLLMANPQGMRLGPFLNILTAWNRGISFSLLASFDSRLILIFITLVLCFGVGILLYKSQTVFGMLGYACVLGGALGNVIDRIYFGAVFDFIDVHLYNWHFYTFNGADSFITMGVIFLLGEYIKERFWEGV